MRHKHTHPPYGRVIYCIFTTEAAVDLDEAMWTLDEGATRHHRHFLIDLMNCHCQPALLIDFGLETRTVHY